MGGKRRVDVDIRGKQNVDKAAKQATQALQGVTNGAKGMMSTLSKAPPVVAAVTAGLVALAVVSKDLVNAYAVQEAAEVKRAAALEATNNAVGISIAEMDAYAAELSWVTTYADEAIVAAQGLMATFTQVGAEVFPQAIEAAADMSAMFGQDLQQSVIQLGTALNDPITGVGRLKRIGISFTETQKDMIAAFMEQNDIMGAQQVIIDELNAEFGGIARAVGEAATGSLPQLTNAFKDLKEENGQWIIEGAEPVIRALRDIVTEAAKATAAMNNIRNLNLDFADGAVDTEYSMDELEGMLAKYEGIQKNSGWGGAPYIQEQIDLIKLLIEHYGEEDMWLIQKRERLAAMERANAILLEQEKEASKWTDEQIRQLGELSKKFRDINELEKLFGDEYDDRAEKEIAVRQTLQEMIEFGFTAEGVAITYFLDQYGEYLEALEEVVEVREKLANMDGGDKPLFDKGKDFSESDKSDSKVDLKAEYLQQMEDEAAALAELQAEQAAIAGEAFSIITGELEGFSGQIVSLTAQFGWIGLALAALQEVMSAFMAVAGPAIEGILEPLSKALRVVGVILGQFIAPILEALTPLIELIATGLVWLFNKILVPIGNGLMFVFNLLYDAVVGVANGLIWVYNKIVSLWNGSQKGYVDYRSLNADMMDAISIDDPSVTDSYDSDYGGAYGVYGGDTTVTRVPDIHFYQTIEGNIIGAGGKEELGEYIVDAIQEYVGAGGTVEFGDA